MAIIIGGTIAAVGAVGGAAISSSGANSAADTAANASNTASNNTLQAQQQMRSDLQPYSSLGTGSINALLQSMGYTGAYDSKGNLTGLTQNSSNPLQQQFSYQAWDPSKLDQTPGYQFTQQQGMKAVTNSNVSRGLGLSGAQLKGISDYTTGNADNTYNQQFANYNTGFNNALTTYNTNYNTASQNVNRLSGLVQAGQNSAAQVGTSGLAAASASGNQLTAGANAGAAAQVAGANAASGAVSSVGQNALLTALLKNNNTSAVSGSSIYGANQSSDPIGALNNSQGWT
jgi:hypothetical protein